MFICKYCGSKQPPKTHTSCAGYNDIWTGQTSCKGCGKRGKSLTGFGSKAEAREAAMRELSA